MLCGVCGSRLPGDLLFTATEREAVERDLSEAKRRAREATAGRIAMELGDTGGWVVKGADVFGIRKQRHNNAALTKKVHSRLNIAGNFCSILLRQPVKT